MKRRFGAMLVVAYAVLGAASASASTLTLRFDTARDPMNFFAGELTSDGSAPYGLVRGTLNQTFTVAATADDETAITGCLISEVLEIVDLDGKVYATSQCADPQTGMFIFTPAPAYAIDRPSEVYARLIATATTDANQTVSPANSNFALMFVEPRIFDEGPKKARGNRFLIRVRIGIPSPRPEKGRFVIQRQRGKAWVTVRTRIPNASGRFATWVNLPNPVNIFRVRFIPSVTTGTHWLAAEVRLRVRRTAVPPKTKTG